MTGLTVAVPSSLACLFFSTPLFLCMYDCTRTCIAIRVNMIVSLLLLLLVCVSIARMSTRLLNVWKVVIYATANEQALLGHDQNRSERRNHLSTDVRRATRVRRQQRCVRYNRSRPSRWSHSRVRLDESSRLAIVIVMNNHHHNVMKT